MRFCRYRLIYCIITTLLFLGVAAMCIYNIGVANSSEGLRVVDKTAKSIILNAGAAKIEVTLEDASPFVIGEYVPVVDAIKPHIRQLTAINVTIIVILLIVYLIDMLDVNGRITKIRAKQGMKLVGEVEGYTNIVPFLYRVEVRACGTVYRSRFPIFRGEFKKYPIGKSAVVYNGGVRRIWVDLDTK